MIRVQWLAALGLISVLATASSAQAQTRPYIGFVYPAGGQQGTTFYVKLGGQGMDGVASVLVTGKGVSAKVIEYCRKFGPQDMQLLSEQLRELKRGTRGRALAAVSTSSKDSGEMMMMDSSSMTAPPQVAGSSSAAGKDDLTQRLIARIEKRMREYVQRPACSSISSLLYVEVKIAPDANPGPRELRVATPRGVSNPLVFHVGQVPEISRNAMITAAFQVLGKENLAQRNRPADEVEQRVTVPGTANGQIASGEVNFYRFQARKGQRLVISAQARQLIPYIADAVPGWFQPVLALFDARGKELAYNDDYRFGPDPTIFFEVPKDGEYVFTITDAIYRGREDFVYRVTIGELPFITSIFPLGGRAGALPKIEMKGWNVQTAKLLPPAQDAKPGIQMLAARDREGLISNRVPFAIDTLPEAFDKESNNNLASAQKVKLPIIVNGRVDREDDWDVFQFTGRAGQTIVAEVSARRLDSPLDSIVRITDAAGKVVALNDDHEDLGAGTNTHHADSYLMVKLPSDGEYFVHVADAARNGGEEYAYRLRISEPRPDFDLRVVPSSVAMRGWASNAVSVYVIRKDGFNGTIKLGLKDPPRGISWTSTTLSGTQPVTRLNLKADLKETKGPINLTVIGTAKMGDREIVREAVPAEDRMQAFLWRHLVPAEEFKALVYNPSNMPSANRPAPERPPLAQTKPAAASTDSASGKGKFTKGQVAGRLRQLKSLYEDWLLTDEFYDRKCAECEAAQ